jgi:hypothetical protein
MAANLMRGFSNMEELILRLPSENAGAAEHYARIEAAQQRNAELSQQLAGAMRDAEQQVAQLQRMFASLVQDQLNSRAAAAGRLAVPPGGGTTAARPQAVAAPPAPAAPPAALKREPGAAGGME